MPDSTASANANPNSIVNALAGKAPNVNVNRPSGEPGASACIRIDHPHRGAQPVFIVDGVTIENECAASSADSLHPRKRASDVDPNEITSVAIFKGPFAVGGAGGIDSIGVVLISTRRSPVRCDLAAAPTLPRHLECTVYTRGALVVVNGVPMEAERDLYCYDQRDFLGAERIETQSRTRVPGQLVPVAAVVITVRDPVAYKCDSR